MSVTYGYIRVSSANQHLDRQLEAIKPYITSEKYLYSDKASGKDFNREGFQYMLKAIESGDSLVIKSVDRLGRNKKQIKKHLDYFKNNNIRLMVIDIPTTLTEVAEGQDWMIEMINNIILEVYTSIAEQERQSIKQRQSEGIEIAKKQGRHLGRPKKELPEGWNKYYKQWREGLIKAVDFMDLMDMKKATFYNKVKEYEKQHGIS